MQEYRIHSSIQVSGTTYTAEAYVRVPDNENTSLPIVVLLHGTSGTISDMYDPSTHPGLHYNRRAVIPSIREHGWRNYPGVSLWGYAVDPLLDKNRNEIKGWQQALNEAGFRTVNYAQHDNRGSLAGVPIPQLSALLGALMNDSRHQGRRFALVGHSRGGILARAVVVDALVRRTFDLGRISQLVTLHSPNQGSSLANSAIDVTRYVNYLRTLPGSALLGDALNFLEAEAGALAYHDFSVGSEFLRGLAAREPVPGIQYITFGGNSTSTTRLRLWWFTADSAVPQWNVPPFRWRTVPEELGAMPPPSPLMSPPIPEMMHGIGDLLVTDMAARLGPWAPHRTNPLNHAEALWAPELQQQVIRALDSRPVLAWSALPGSAVDIGVGANGATWVIGTDRVGGGYGIHQWTGSSWVRVDGGAVRIAVDPSGQPWVVNSNGSIYQRTGGVWKQLPGSAKDIGVGANGAVWVIGTDAVGGGYGIHQWTGSSWVRVDGGAVGIAVDPRGQPWVVNSNCNIYRRG